MEAKDRTDTSWAKRAAQSPAGRIAVKAAGWVVAVPALCALVVIGGAAPIYLLLPEAPVVEGGSPAGTSRTASTVPAAQSPDVVAQSVQAPESVDVGVAPPDAPPLQEETLAAGDHASMTADDAADGEPPVEVVEEQDPAAIVVPTARPRREAADENGPTTRAARTADLRPASRREPAAEPVQRQQASRPTRRFVTIRPVALRSAPGGREVAMLGRGAEVLAGPCDDWCEVVSGGRRGWIHPSFLSASAPKERGRRSAPRTINPYDDEPILFQQTRRYDRRYDRRREAVPYWMLDEDRPVEIDAYDGRR